jgi:hypothetical protein
MKKRIYLIVVFLLFFSFSQAQLLEIGVKAGVNYANFESSQLQTEALTSYHVGLLAQIRLGKSFALQPEVLYSYKNLVDEVKAELGYVSVPLLTKINFGKTFSVELGPHFSWLLSKSVDVNTDVKELDFGVAGGVAVNLTEHLFIQGRYVAGLTEIGKNADIKNSVGQLSIGYLF